MTRRRWVTACRRTATAELLCQFIIIGIFNIPENRLSEFIVGGHLGNILICFYSNGTLVPVWPRQKFTEKRREKEFCQKKFKNCKKHKMWCEDVMNRQAQDAIQSNAKQTSDIISLSAASLFRKHSNRSIMSVWRKNSSGKKASDSLKKKNTFVFRPIECDQQQTCNTGPPTGRNTPRSVVRTRQHEIDHSITVRCVFYLNYGHGRSTCCSNSWIKCDIPGDDTGKLTIHCDFWMHTLICWHGKKRTHTAKIKQTEFNRFKVDAVILWMFSSKVMSGRRFSENI